MNFPWRSATLACAVLAASAAKADDMIDPVRPDRGVSDVDVSIGRGDAPAPGIRGLKLFPQPLPGTAQPGATSSREIGPEEGMAIRRDSGFVGEVGDVSLPEVVAAARSDPDQPGVPRESGAPVNEWTGQIDTQGPPELAPPGAPPEPRDAAGSPSDGTGAPMIP